MWYSVLLITDKLKIDGNVNLHTMPHRGFKASIEKHNHTYVKLVWPWTKVEASQGQTTALEQTMELWSLKLVEGRVNYRNSSIHLKPSADGLNTTFHQKARLSFFHSRGELSFQSQMKYPLVILMGSLVQV